MPCVSTPRRLAPISTSAASMAWSCEYPIRMKTCSTNRRKESAAMRLATMLSLLRHFNHDFEASIAARSVQFVGVNDIRERQTMRNELAYVYLAGSDQVDSGSRGGLIWFDGCTDDRLRATAFVKQN